MQEGNQGSGLEGARGGAQKQVLPAAGAVGAVAGIQQQPAQKEPLTWNCQYCTFENTINNWSDKSEAICEVCNKTDSMIYRKILEAIQQSDGSGGARRQF